MRISNTTPSICKFNSPINDVSDKKIWSNTNINGDSVSISNLAKNTLSKQNQKSSMLESLFKQKQNIINSRSNLIERTIENGGSLDTIKSQLEDFDEQLTAIDKQIEKYMFDQEQKALDINKKEEILPDKKPKTETEIEANRFNKILSLSNNISQMEFASSVKKEMQGQARILKREIEIDESRSKSGLKATSKRAELSKIENRISSVDNKISENMQDINEKIKADDYSEDNITPPKPDEEELQ